MKPRALISVIAIAVMTAITIPIVLAAQDAAVQGKPAQHHQYKLIDLGTLGGPNSFIPNPLTGAELTNASQVVGESDTLIPDPYTPNCLQSTCLVNHTFSWQKGILTDLGTLGGVFGVPNWLNSRDEVVGTSDLAGDVNFHGFLWHRGSLQDLGTLGGDNSEAFWINDAGEVVGPADVSGSQSHHAFIWRNGVMTDLGTLGDFPCSTAVAINSAEQTVGDTGVCHVGGGPPFLSEHGQHMVDLSKLVLPGSDITLTDAVTINDRGEIGGMGVLPSGDTHAYVLIPCDDDHADVEGCDYSMVDASVAQNSNTAPRPAAMTQPSTLSPAQTVNQLRNRWMQRYRLPGQRPVLRD